MGDQHSAAFAALVHNRGTILRDLGIAEEGVPLIAQAFAKAKQQFGLADRRTVIALRNLAFARAEASADPAADLEWQTALKQLAPTWPATDRYTLWLVGAHIAATLEDGTQAVARLAQADHVADSESLKLPPILRLRRMTIGGAARSLAGRNADAEAQFAQAAVLAAELGDDAWSAHWRNALAFGEHWRRRGDSRRAAPEFGAALRLLEERGGDRASKLRERLRALAIENRSQK